MKRRQILRMAIAALAVCGMMTACNNSNNQVRDFAISAAKKFSSNQVDSIRAIYPGAEKIDSFALDFNPDSLDVEKTEAPNTFKVRFSQNADMVVEMTEDGKMTVKESRGLFAYPADRMDLAKKTGQWNSSITDLEFSKRMEDTMFPSWIQSKMADAMKSLVKITKSNVSKKHISDYWTSSEKDVCTYTIEVSNETDQEIGGNDYTISAIETWKYFEDGWADLSFRETTKRQSSSKMLTGKPIPPKGSVTYSWNRSFEGSHHFGYKDFDVNATVNFTSNKASFGYKFTGKEYEEYQNSK